MSTERISLVVFDWAGTTVDFGCFAPVAAFISAFEAYGVQLTADEARGPMGLHKQDHIAQLLQLPRIAEQWVQRWQRQPDADDVREIYERFTPVQEQTAVECSQLIEGTLETVQWLRERQIAVGSSTGYPRSVADGVMELAERGGYRPDSCVCSDEVSQGRPAPWMIFRNMELNRVYPPRAVVKVGDTVPDVVAGLNAGVWSVGVTDSSSDVGHTATELHSMDPVARDSLCAAARERLAQAGAHLTISTIAELPAAIERIELALADGVGPETSLGGHLTAETA
jgi:phosphonoacetaldehyde hydrolase